jgi:ATP-dependent RNA helicase DeaD
MARGDTQQMQLQIAEDEREGFEAFDLPAEVSRALAEMGFSEPTEIQARAILPVLEGRDVMGQAQTGTGKTAAFGIPAACFVHPEDRYPQTLILAPTRELASQISDELSRIMAHQKVIIATIYGGTSMGPQLDALQAGAQIVVGTPGRVLDHLRRGTLRLDQLEMVVLDEADRMLDMGFMPDVEKILRATPSDRQTLLFSATMPLVIRIMARRYMHNPVWIVVKPQQQTVDEVEQVYYEVAEQDKPYALLEVIRKEEPERMIVFRRTQMGVDRLTRFLVNNGIKAEAIHGSLTQAIRERTLNSFRNGDLTVLVATNVAARGLDVPEVSHVVNFDIPEETESYIHRIGRTARMGRRGVAVTFVAEWDAEPFQAIQKVARGAIEQRSLEMYSA